MSRCEVLGRVSRLTGAGRPEVPGRGGVLGMEMVTRLCPTGERKLLTAQRVVQCAVPVATCMATCKTALKYTGVKTVEKIARNRGGIHPDFA